MNVIINMIVTIVGHKVEIINHFTIYCAKNNIRAIIWTTDGIAYLRIYAPFDLDELDNIKHNMVHFLKLF